MSTALVHSYIGKFSMELFSSQGLNKAYCRNFCFIFCCQQLLTKVTKIHYPPKITSYTVIINSNNSMGYLNCTR